MRSFVKALFQIYMQSLIAGYVEVFISVWEILWFIQLDKTWGKHMSESSLMSMRLLLCSVLWEEQ